MPTYLLVDRLGTVIDCAALPSQLDFSKVSRCTQYAVSITWGGPVYTVATTDLTGYENQADWVASQLCEEIDFRRAFESFEDEIKNADRPLITFGKPDVGPDGSIP